MLEDEQHAGRIQGGLKTLFPLSVNDWIDLRHRLSGGLSYAKPGETNLSWKPRKTGTARRCNLNIERVHNSNLTGINHETHEVGRRL